MPALNYYPGKHGQRGFNRYGEQSPRTRGRKPAPARTWFAAISAWTLTAYYGHQITAEERRTLNDLAASLDAAQRAA